MITCEKLDQINRDHARELKRLRAMTDSQYEGFKKNFTIGILDPELSRFEAIDILISMIAVNRKLRRGLSGNEVSHNNPGGEE
ncbi:MAG: hypothetical protein CVV64_03090 [Candidatus Wallbacteria bacterium HGW-Wallbacteria-1]|jgi:hypothetical protein|uniref:Uncharacterized protein n=1 Tax=Candidatus Wallbacteria bacterium HGW-Wallbacteria-1 TaxID=2013854 RepID=A0A2N1PTI5_9BACT|nr:MAG: hypothetical protein CVV64_03090 [Candidatus Wallbacteria bacterium HGW-Wallbacteria-1]